MNKLVYGSIFIDEHGEVLEGRYLGSLNDAATKTYCRFSHNTKNNEEIRTCKYNHPNIEKLLFIRKS